MTNRLLSKTILGAAVAFLPAIVLAVVLMVPTPVHREPAPITTFAPIIEQVRPAVVHVERKGVCQGSGCLLTPDGIMFTAKHISDGTHGEYTITLDDGRTFPVKYTIEDTENDLTFMQLDLQGAEPNLPCVSLAQTDPNVGDFVIVGGSPLGKDNFNTFSMGIVSATGRDLYNRYGWERYQRYNWHAMVQTTSPTFPGNSGGPIFNMRGEVIGVLVARQAETLDFGVPVARFRETIDTVRDWFRLCRFDVVEEGEDEDEPECYHSGNAIYPCH